MWLVRTLIGVWILVVSARSPGKCEGGVNLLADEGDKDPKVVATIYDGEGKHTGKTRGSQLDFAVETHRKVKDYSIESIGRKFLLTFELAVPEFSAFRGSLPKLKSSIAAIFRRPKMVYEMLHHHKAMDSPSIDSPSMTNNLVDAFLNIGILDALGLFQTIQQVLQVNEDGIPIIDWSSVNGIMTAISLPSQFVGAAFAPIFAVDAFQRIGSTVALKFPRIFSALKKLRPAFAARLLTKIGGHIGSISPIKYAALLEKATAIMTYLGPVLSVFDTAVSIYFLVAAIQEAGANTDPNLFEFHRWNIWNAAIGAVGSSIILIATTVIAIGAAGAAGSVFAGTAFGSAMASVAGTAAFGTALSVASMALPVVGAILIVFMLVAMILASYFQNRAECNTMDGLFNQYLIQIVRELYYLSDPNKTSTEFNMYQLPDRNFNQAYVELDEIVINENSVHPTVSKNFLRQLRGGQENMDHLLGNGTNARNLKPLLGNWNVERNVSIESVVLPNNLFTEVGTHSCNNTRAKSWHINIGFCDARKNHKYYFTDGQTNQRHYEWTEGSASRIIGCTQLPNAYTSDMFGMEFALCHLKCDQRSLWDGVSCNAISYDFKTMNCKFYMCEQGQFLLPVPLEKPHISRFGISAFFREKSTNCGGYYATTCSECLPKEMCNGECRWDGRICKHHGCEKCIFPFTYEHNGLKKEYWGCTKTDTSPGWCATEVNQDGELVVWENCPNDDQCKQTCGGYVCSDSAKYIAALRSKVCGTFDCTDEECECTARRGAAPTSPSSVSMCRTESSTCVGGSYTVGGFTFNTCTTYSAIPMNWYDYLCPICLAIKAVTKKKDYWETSPWCPIEVDEHNAYTLGSNKYIECDVHNPACVPTCDLYEDCHANMVRKSNTPCINWQCTEDHCCEKQSGRRARRLQHIRVSSALLRVATSRRKLSQDDQEPASSNVTLMDKWIFLGQQILVTDPDCMQEHNKGSNRIATQQSLIVLAGTGYAKTRHLNVVVNKDELVLQSVNIQISPNEMMGPTPNIDYNIVFNGAPTLPTEDVAPEDASDENEPPEPTLECDGDISIRPKSVRPRSPPEPSMRFPAVIKPVASYIVTVPPMRTSSMPPERTSSFTYKFHLKNPRMTKLQIEFPSYAQHSFAGYSWGGNFGIKENCVAPFAKLLTDVDKVWSMRVRTLSNDPKRLVTLFRRLKVSSAANNRVVFYVKRGIYSCSIDHMRQTYMLESITAQDPQQESIWETQIGDEAFSYVEGNKFGVHVKRSLPLANIIATLKDYRAEIEVNNFMREGRLVQVVLGNSTDVSFYFNSEPNPEFRFWDIFVPRGVQCGRGKSTSEMTYRVLNLDDALLLSKPMYSCSILPTAINVTYEVDLPNLLNSEVDAGLVTIMLPYSGSPYVTKVVCQVCRREDVQQAIAQAAIQRNGTLDQMLSLTDLVIVNTHRRNGSQMLSRTPLSLYTTQEMEQTPFAYDNDEVYPLGYFWDVRLLSGCIMAGQNERNATNGSALLYRAYASVFDSNKTLLEPVTIPQELSATDAVANGFRGFVKSKTPGCDGVEVATASFTKYCITCSEAFRLESHRQTSVPNIEPRWASFDKNNTLPNVVDAPTYTFSTFKNVGKVEYQDYTFSIPTTFLTPIEGIPDRPWSVVNPRQQHYRFAGVVRTGIESNDFGLYVSLNSSSYYKCTTSSCAILTEEIQPTFQMDEMRLRTNEPSGILILEKAEGQIYGYTMKRIIADTESAAGEFTSAYPSVLLEWGENNYLHGTRDFHSSENLTLLSEGSTNNVYFVNPSDIVHQLGSRGVTALPVRLGFLMKQRSKYPHVLHLEFLPGSDDVKVPAVDGYEALVVTFAPDATLQNISISFGPDWEHTSIKEVSLFVPDTISQALVFLRSQLPFALNATEVDLSRSLSSDVIVRARFLPAEDTVNIKERREENLKAQKIADRYSLYGTPTIPASMSAVCDGCVSPKVCIAHGICLSQSSILREHSPIWRDSRLPDNTPDSMYCYMNWNVPMNRRCAHLYNFYAFVVRTLLPLANTPEKRVSGARATSFGTGVLCDTADCAREEIYNALVYAPALSTFSSFNEPLPTFVLHKTTNMTWALWPNFEQGSPLGSADATHLSLLAKCESGIPPEVALYAKTHPDFGRLVEQVYFEEEIGTHCVRISAAHANLPTVNNIEWPFDSNAAMDGVDIRQSTVFSLVDSLITLIDVAQNKSWEASNIQPGDIVWSLYQDANGKYFDRYGGLTVRKWNIQRVVESRAEDTEDTFPLYDILKKLLNAVTPSLNPLLINGTQTAVSSLVELEKLVTDKKTLDVIQNWNRMKSTFSTMLQCTMPINPSSTLTRYLLSLGYTPSSNSTELVGLYRVSFGDEASVIVVDDSCFAYIFQVSVLCGEDEKTFQVHYNGIDWAPIQDANENPGACNVAAESPLADTVPDSTPFSVPTNRTGCADKVRLRILHADNLCDMAKNQSLHIYAVQLYDKTNDTHYVGQDNSTYELLSAISDRWELRYNGTTVWTASSATRTSCVHNEVEIGPFVVEDPMFVTELVPDVVMNGCNEPMETNRTWKCVPQPDFETSSLSTTLRVNRDGEVLCAECTAEDALMFDSNGSAVLDVTGELFGEAGIGYVYYRTISNVETKEACEQSCIMEDICRAFNMAISPNAMVRYYAPNRMDTYCHLYRFPAKGSWSAAETVRTELNEIRSSLNTLLTTLDQRNASNATKQAASTIMSNYQILASAATHPDASVVELREALRIAASNLTTVIDFDTLPQRLQNKLIEADILDQSRDASSSLRSESESIPLYTSDFFSSGDAYPPAERQFCATVEEDVDPCCPRVSKTEERLSFCMSNTCHRIRESQESAEYICAIKYCAPCSFVPAIHLDAHRSGSQIPVEFNGSPQCAIGCHRVDEDRVTTNSTTTTAGSTTTTTDRPGFLRRLLQVE